MSWLHCTSAGGFFITTKPGRSRCSVGQLSCVSFLRPVVAHGTETPSVQDEDVVLG